MPSKRTLLENFNFHFLSKLYSSHLKVSSEGKKENERVRERIFINGTSNVQYIVEQRAVVLRRPLFATCHMDAFNKTCYKNSFSLSTLLLSSSCWWWWWWCCCCCCWWWNFISHKCEFNDATE